MCLQFCLLHYRLPLTCSQKSLSLLRSIGGIRVFALLLFLTTDGVLKRILKYAVLSRMPLELTFLRRVSLQTRISQCGYLQPRGLIGWVSLGIVFVEPLKLSIGGLIRSLVPLTVLSAPILSSLPEDWPLTGQIISTTPVCGNIARIMTRHCIVSTLSAQHWDSKVKMDPYCIDELYFWKNNLNSIKVRDCFSLISHSASLTPMPALQGVLQLLHLMRIVCHKLWEPAECSKSSTWRELAAIVFALESFAPILEGSLVKWFTDSQTTARIIEVGGMKLDLHRLAIKIFQFCAEHSIRLEVQWIPLTENEKADYISRLIDFDDWHITHDLFLIWKSYWARIQLTVLPIIIQQSSLDSFRVS